jgi:predicted AAA+ superfamily ATPase
MEQLISFRDKQLIKVVTGIRRCGKSTLLDLFADYLRENNVEDRQIIRLNLEYPEYHDLQTYMRLYEHVKERLQEDRMNYIQRNPGSQPQVSVDDGFYAQRVAQRDQTDQRA